MDIQVIPLSKEYLDHYDDIDWDDRPSVPLWESELLEDFMEVNAKCGGKGKGGKKRKGK